MEEAKNYDPNANYGIKMTMEVAARATETLANTNTTHHTHAVVKEAGVRLERTAVRSQQGQNESGGGGPCLANLQMVNLAVNGLTFSITTYHGEDEREEHQCMRAVCQVEGREELHQEAQSLTSWYYELKPRLKKITRDLSLFATYSWSSRNVCTLQLII